MPISPLYLLLGLSFWGALPARAAEELVDRVAAIVDGSPILYSDVMQKVRSGPLVVVSEFPATESAPAYEKALQDAVNFELVIAKAKEMEIDVRDEEVEAEIRGFLESRGLNRDGLLEHLRGQGMTYEDYRSDFKNQMILRRFQGRVITPLVKITDRDVETYFMKKVGAADDAMELVLRQILIALPKGAAEDIVDAKKRLVADVHQKLKDGMAFVDAVKVYSDDQNARESGGLMRGLKLKDLAGTIRGAVQGLDVGQFSTPTQTAMGFHIFYLEEKQFIGTREYAQQKRQLEMELRTLELASQTRQWLNEQRQRSKVEIIAN